MHVNSKDSNQICPFSVGVFSRVSLRAGLVAYIHTHTQSLTNLFIEKKIVKVITPAAAAAAKTRTHTRSNSERARERGRAAELFLRAHV